ncbi:MAG: AraC family transcriptional regulator [Planctomycetota bacterium]|jgi:AraC family transcriptional regulator of arabinose operon|nr:AraC family transcriptional regulator [Planctomycetota bacterium]
MSRRSHSVYRSVGWGGDNDRIGAGFIDKSGVHRDFVDNISPALVIVAVLEGRGEFIDEHGRRTALEPGMVFQRTPGRVHSSLIDPASSWHECFIEVGARLNRGLFGARILRDDLYAWRCPLVDSLPERIQSLQTRLSEAAEPTLPRVTIDMLALVEQIQATASIQGDATEQLVDEACRYLSDNFPEARNLQAFCTARELGYERFRKQFHRRVGVSPHRYRIRRRLDAACQYLYGSEHSIAAIAERLGYASPYEFSAQFRRHMGVPPSRFRGQ